MGHVYGLAVDVAHDVGVQFAEALEKAVIHQRFRQTIILQVSLQKIQRFCNDRLRKMLTIVDQEQLANVFRAKREQHILQEAQTHVELAIFLKHYRLRVLLLSFALFLDIIDCFLLVVRELKLWSIFFLISCRTLFLNHLFLELVEVLDPLNDWLESAFDIHYFKLLTEW